MRGRNACKIIDRYDLEVLLGHGILDVGRGAVDGPHPVEVGSSRDPGHADRFADRARTLSRARRLVTRPRARSRRARSDSPFRNCHAPLTAEQGRGIRRVRGKSHPDTPVPGGALLRRGHRAGGRRCSWSCSRAFRVVECRRLGPNMLRCDAYASCGLDDPCGRGGGECTGAVVPRTAAGFSAVEK